MMLGFIPVLIIISFRGPYLTNESQILKTILDTIGHEVDSSTGDTIYDIKETTETHIKQNHHAVHNTQILSIPFGLSFNKRFNTKHEMEMDWWKT